MEILNREHTLLVEKYRSKTLEDYVGNEHIKSTIEKYLKQNDIQNFLFYGGAGCGKTTLAKLIVNNLDCDYLYINSSDERGIDTIRDKVSDYIQGSEQVTFEAKYLVVTKSLKDIMSFKTLGIGNVETIAPDSENTVIAENIMKKYIHKYAKIILIFDNDEPGIEAAKTYKKRYGFEYVVLPFEKDISDTVKARGIQETRNIVFKSIKALL